MRRVATLCAMALAACGGPQGADPLASVRQAIAGGVPATDYPEACWINISTGTQTGYCSASLVAPMLMLTAGHCVSGMTVTEARCPSLPGALGGRSFAIDRGIAHPSFSDSLGNVSYDVGGVVRGETVSFNGFPALASSPPSVGDPIVRVGRVLNGIVTSSMYKSTGAVGALEPQFIVVSPDIAVERGDSGGPDMGGASHVVDGVNSHLRSRCNTSTGVCDTYAEAYSRVDVFRAWIQQQIDRYGTPPCSTTGCPSGQRCDAATQRCASGCTTTGCPANERCDPSREACIAGCAITGCASGERCDGPTQECAIGCASTGCQFGEMCDGPTQVCVPAPPCPEGQLRNPATGECEVPNVDPSRRSSDPVVGSFGCQASSGLAPWALAPASMAALRRRRRRYLWRNLQQRRPVEP